MVLQVRWLKRVWKKERMTSKWEKSVLQRKSDRRTEKTVKLLVVVVKMFWSGGLGLPLYNGRQAPGAGSALERLPQTAADAPTL